MATSSASKHTSVASVARPGLAPSPAVILAPAPAPAPAKLWLDLLYSPRAIDCCGILWSRDSVSDVAVPILSTESGNVATEPGDFQERIAGDLV